MKSFLKTLAFSLLDQRRTRGYDLMRDLRYWLKGARYPGIVLDVGANDGSYAIEFRTYLKTKIHAFEPVDSTFAKLSAKVAAYPDIFPHNIAMGAEPGEAEIAVNPNTSLVSSLRPNSRWHADAVRQTVRVSTIDLFIREQNLANVAVLKIDVEGFEPEVLRGAADSLQRGVFEFLVLETSFRPEADNYPVPVDQLFAQLQPFRYEPWGVYDCERLQGDRGGIRYMNVVFGRGRQ